MKNIYKKITNYFLNLSNFYKKSIFIIFVFIIILIFYFNKPNVFLSPTIIVKEQTINDSLNVEKVQIVKFIDLNSQDLYIKNCKFCHGSYGKGDGIKARVNDKICPFDLSKETKPNKFIYYVILNGKDRMPSHEQLNDTSIKILIIHIKKFKK